MQREALESANTNTQVLTTMKNAADALKAAHKNMDVDQVHDMMDDIAEQQDVAKEISDAISNPVAFGECERYLVLWMNVLADRRGPLFMSHLLISQ